MDKLIKVGQVWKMRGGGLVKIEKIVPEDPQPIQGEKKSWSANGQYWNGRESRFDLIELINE